MKSATSAAGVASASVGEQEARLHSITGAQEPVQATNGTFVKGVGVQRCELRPGDWLELGGRSSASRLSRDPVRTVAPVPAAQTRSVVRSAPDRPLLAGGWADAIDNGAVGICTGTAGKAPSNPRALRTARARDATASPEMLVAPAERVSRDRSLF
jgi:hypothetical protein